MTRRSRFSFRFKLISAIGAVTAILICLGAFYFWKYDPLALRYPGDQEILSLFQKHRDAFERLGAMAKEDANKVSYLSVNSLPSVRLNENRRDEYIRLLSGIRRDLVIRIDPSFISFSYWGGGVGLATGRSWMKGIAYLPDGYAKAGILVDALDKRPINDGIYLHPIVGKWYVAYIQSE
jgi:hypothetical protein